ncbi:N-acetyltransferase family protein [Geodermatophilus sp. SYSU D00710]
MRRATAADVPAVVALLADDPLGAGREAADLAPYETAFAAVDADPAHLLVVADDGGTVLGTLQLSFLPGLSRGGALRAQVEGVRVSSSARGRGLGGRCSDGWPTRPAAAAPRWCSSPPTGAVPTRTASTRGWATSPRTSG